MRARDALEEAPRSASPWPRCGAGRPTCVLVVQSPRTRQKPTQGHGHITLSLGFTRLLGASTQVLTPRGMHGARPVTPRAGRLPPRSAESWGHGSPG